MVEYFDVVDRNDKVIGKATRQECHSNNRLIHRAVCILVFNSKKELLFEKRSMKKDMEPGKWGLVAGHVDAGESYEHAARREMLEEIGVSCSSLKIEHSILFTEKRESEIIKIFSCNHDGPFKVNKQESDEIRFFKQNEIKDALKTGSISITQSDMQILNDFFKN